MSAFYELATYALAAKCENQEAELTDLRARLHAGCVENPDAEIETSR